MPTCPWGSRRSCVVGKAFPATAGYDDRCSRKTCRRSDECHVVYSKLTYARYKCIAEDCWTLRRIKSLSLRDENDRARAYLRFSGCRLAFLRGRFTVDDTERPFNRERSGQAGLQETANADRYVSQKRPGCCRRWESIYSNTIRSTSVIDWDWPTRSH